MSAMRHDMKLLISTESLVFGTFVVDNTHRIVSWNAAATRTLGYDADVTLGCTSIEMLRLLRTQDVTPCPDLVLEQGLSSLRSTDVAAARDADAHSLHNYPDGPVRLRVVAQDGDPRWLSVSVVHALSQDGAPCVVHVFRDVSDDTESQARGEIAAPPADHVHAIRHLSAASADHEDRLYEAQMTPEHLTPREHEVLKLLAHGLATIEIAAELGISRVTARNHVTRVIEKLGVRTRLQAVLAATRLGLV